MVSLLAGAAVEVACTLPCWFTASLTLPSPSLQPHHCPPAHSVVGHDKVNPWRWARHPYLYLHSHRYGYKTHSLTLTPSCLHLHPRTHSPPRPHTHLTLTPSPSPTYPLALVCTSHLMPSHLCIHLTSYSCPRMHSLSHTISPVHPLNLSPSPSPTHPFTLTLTFTPTHSCLYPCTLSLACSPHP